VCDSNAAEWCIDFEADKPAPDRLTEEGHQALALPPKSFVIYEQESSAQKSYPQESVK
jgi:hypothetical protein